MDAGQTGAGRRRTFHTLEGLRAIGAFLVVTRHAPVFFGAVTPPESFLAVDLFYLISGFVVAHAYEERLEGGGFTRTFIKTRLIRLYPLYVLGLALGALTVAVVTHDDPGSWWTGEKLAYATLAGLLLAPILPGVPANGGTLNGPTWTLLPELLANIFYAVAIRFMSLATLTAIMIASALGLVYAEFLYGTLDVGFRPGEHGAALARVGFSFFAGVLLYRLSGARRIASPLAAWGCLAALAGALLYEPPEGLAPYYELAMVLAGFPALVALASVFEPGPRTGRMFATLGLLSYAIYVLHQPAARLLYEAFLVFGAVPRDYHALLLGVAFLAGLTALAWWLDRAYDAPIRAALRRRFLGAAETAKTA